MLISAATARNWKRLGSKPQGRLCSRANKTQSQKRFIPSERLAHAASKRWIEALLGAFPKADADLDSILLRLVLNLSRRAGIERQAKLQDFLAEYSNVPVIDSLLGLSVPKEADILGTVLQSFLAEGAKNALGSYYKPPALARRKILELPRPADARLLDPCYGSSAFLIAAPRARSGESRRSRHRSDRRHDCEGEPAPCLSRAPLQAAGLRRQLSRRQ